MTLPKVLNYDYWPTGGCGKLIRTSYCHVVEGYNPETRTSYLPGLKSKIFFFFFLSIKSFITKVASSRQILEILANKESFNHNRNSNKKKIPQNKMPKVIINAANSAFFRK